MRGVECLDTYLCRCWLSAVCCRVVCMSVSSVCHGVCQRWRGVPVDDGSDGAVPPRELAFPRRQLETSPSNMRGLLNRVQSLRVFGVRYAAEFSGKARVRARRRHSCRPAPPSHPLEGSWRARRHAKCAHKVCARQTFGQRACGALSCSRAMLPSSLLPYPPPLIFFARRPHAPRSEPRRSPPILQSLGIQTCLEATAAGTFFAVWWRISHVSEKNLYDKYYTNLRAEQAALADE